MGWSPTLSIKTLKCGQTDFLFPNSALWSELSFLSSRVYLLQTIRPAIVDFRHGLLLTHTKLNFYIFLVILILLIDSVFFCWLTAAGRLHWASQEATWLPPWSLWAETQEGGSWSAQKICYSSEGWFWFLLANFPFVRIFQLSWVIAVPFLIELWMLQALGIKGKMFAKKRYAEKALMKKTWVFLLVSIEVPPVPLIL